MSCDITRGRLEQCKNSVGGLKAVYFVNFGDMGAITYDVTDTDVITAVAGTPNAYNYINFVQILNLSLYGQWG